MAGAARDVGVRATIDAAGSYLHHPSADTRFGADLGHGHSLARDHPGVLDASTGLSGAHSGPESLIALAPVRPAGPQSAPRWAVVRVEERAVAFEPVRTFQLALAGIALLALVLTLGLGTIAARRWLLQPLASMQALVSRYRQGEYSAEAAGVGPGEIGDLGRSLMNLGPAVGRRHAELSTLYTVTERMNAGRTLDEVCDHVFEVFHQVIPYDRIGVALLEDGGDVLRARWSRSGGDTPIKLLDGYTAPMAGSSLQPLLENHELRIINDLEAYLAEHPDSESTALIVEEGIRSSLTCPLVAEGQPIGFLFFSSRERDTYRGAHVDLFRYLAGQVSLTLEKGRMYDKLEALNAEKNRFMGVAAHDLRSPLASIQGYASLVSHGLFGAQSDEAKRVLGLVDKTCDRMLALVSDLLDVAAIEAGHLDLQRREVDLAELLEELHEANRVLAAVKGIELALEVGPELPLVDADPTRVTQVINNLLSNAIKFSHAGTRISISAGATDGGAEVRVLDQGQGIPVDEQPTIFDGFAKSSVRATAGERSTGLGLAIVRRVVEAHGGSIRVESEPGQGSTFAFTLLAASHGSAGASDVVGPGPPIVANASAKG